MDTMNWLSFDLRSFGIVSSMTLILYITYLYMFKFNFWRKKGIPGPFPIPLFGAVWTFLTKPIHEIMMSNFKNHGRIVGGFEGTKPTLSITDLQVIKNVLVRDFHVFTNRRTFLADDDSVMSGFVSIKRDAEWKRVRNVLTPTFTSGKMRQMFPIMKSCVQQVVELIQEEIQQQNSKTDQNSNLGAQEIDSNANSDGLKAPKLARIDSKKLFGSYSLDIIGRCCFGTITNAYRDPKDPFVSQVSKLFNPGVLRMILFFTLPIKWITKAGFGIFPREPEVFYTKLTETLLEQRSKSGVKGQDFLQTLIDAQADEPEISSESNSEPKNVLERGKLSKKEIIAQLMIFFVAGYETTATLLKYAFYELAINQDIQERLRSELVKDKDQDNDFDYEHTVSNTYLEAFVTEVLRKYPPATILERESSSDYEIVTSDNKKFILPKGTVISIPVYVVHHDEENFPNPSKFDSERFMPDNKPNIKPYSWLPFGAGNRNCVGLRFAMLEAKILIAMIVSGFKVTPNDQTKIKYTKGSGFLMSEPIFVDFQER